MTVGGYQGEYFDAGPLLSEVRRRGLTFHRESGEHRALNRAKAAGRVTRNAADRFAVETLGMHPCELWPHWFELVEVAS